MHKRFCTALFLGFFLLAPGAIAAENTPMDSGKISNVGSLITHNSMNVFRRFVPTHRAAMIEFYEKVLDLRPMRPINLASGRQILRFHIGSGQIKLTSGLKKGRRYHLGAVDEGTGIRLFTLFFPDATTLAGRFRKYGYPAPKFRDYGDGRRAALVKDPGGFTLKLVIVPHAPADTYAKLEVGINVSDLEKSRAFYRDFVGLDELPPVKDTLLGMTKYPYRHGETTINLWSVGKNLPADTGSAGIQYVVSDVETVNSLARKRRVTVETPLGSLPGFNLRFVWLNDPDGVTNYFAQVGIPNNKTR